jgi:hypothetical protein
VRLARVLLFVGIASTPMLVAAQDVGNAPRPEPGVQGPSARAPADSPGPAPTSAALDWAPRTRRVGFEVERAARDLDAALQLDVARAVAQHLESVGFRAVELELSTTCPSSTACRIAQLESAGAEAFAQVVLSNESIGPRVDLVWLSVTSTTVVPIVGRATPKARVFEQIAPVFSGPVTALRRGAGEGEVLVHGLPGDARLVLDDRDPLTLPAGGPWTVRIRRAEPDANLEVRVGDAASRLPLGRAQSGPRAIVFVPEVRASVERGLFGASLVLGAAGVIAAGVGAALEAGRPRVTCIDLGGGCGDALLGGAPRTPGPLPVSPLVIGAGLATHGLLASAEALIRGEPSQSVLGFLLDAAAGVATSIALAASTR